MAIVRIEKIQVIMHGKPTKNHKDLLILRCDECDKEFSADCHTRNKKMKKDIHYCSTNCSGIARRKGSLADIVHKEKMLEKYGVENISQLTNIKNKKKETSLKNYGVDHPHKSKEIMYNVQNTNIQKYGAPNVMNNPIIVDKFKNSIFEKYGVENISQLDSIKEKKKETCLQNYRVESPMFSDEIKSKYDFKGNWKKAHETKKKNGSYKKSKLEDDFYIKLIEYFPETQRQLLINNWSIDFYIESINAYIQFDGVYWHGLIPNMDLSKDNQQNKGIMRKIEIDKNQNEWFRLNNLKLIRITDLQFKILSFETIVDLIKN